MPEPRPPQRAEVRLGADLDAPDAPLMPSRPLRIGLVGDFGARAHRRERADPAVLGIRPRLVDRDTLDQVLAEVAPEIHLPVGAPGEIVRFRFATLDHFHPDHLFAHHPLFADLRELRRQLLGGPPRTEPAAGPRRNTAAEPPPDGLLDAIVGRSSTAPAAPSFPGGDLQDFLNAVVAPHVVPAPGPQQERVLAQVDAAASAALRALLHHPTVQALESLWRGLRLLVRRIESDALVRVFLIDMSVADLNAAADAGVDPHSSGVPGALAEGEDGGWDLLVALDYFGADSRDLARLRWLGAVGRALGAPWLTGAHPRLVGRDSFGPIPDQATWRPAPAPAWLKLRETTEAGWVGLALPRVLLREPYGAGGPTCETLPFEEWDEQAGHDALLWGHPAWPGLLTVADAFVRLGDPWHAAMEREVSGLPLHVAGVGSASRVTPCAEGPLGADAAARLAESGFSPIASVPATDRVHLVRLQTMAKPQVPWPWRTRDATQ